MKRWLPHVLRLILLALLIAFLVWPQGFEPIFRPLAQQNAPAIYNQGSLLALTMQHLATVAVAIFAAAVVAIALAILVSRPFGREFLPLSRSLVNIGQTFPPVAVLALAVPVFGFGEKPTLIALFLYGLLPIFENTLTGLTTLPQPVMEAARGTGMTEGQRLFRIELPLAMPVILSGIRLSAVIGLATATLGSTVAARTLGEVIIGLLAVLIYDALSALERRLSVRI